MSMLSNIDKALAGAIDYVADDLQATVKSVRENGVRRTLTDAVEDAAGLVGGGMAGAMGGLFGGRKAAPSINNHSGVSSGYADICAGPGSKFGAQNFTPNTGAGGAQFAYVPRAGSNNAPSAVPKFSAGGFSPGSGFAPGIGIQRAGGYQPNGGVQVFAKSNSGPSMGFNALPGHSAPAPYMPAPAPYAPYAGAAASAAAATGGYSSSSTTNYGPPVPIAKEPPVNSDELEVRIQKIKDKEAANQKCMDCAAPNPEWASVSFGILLCIECGGHHRQMGTHISRIRSCKMDTWTERQLCLFDDGVGGNGRLAQFFAANGVDHLGRYQRYQTPAAEWYREGWIKNRIFARPVPPPAAGIQTGPCSAEAPKAKAAPAPQVDLLDFDGGGAAQAAKPSAQSDLLGFDGPSGASAEADLLGVSTAAPAARSGGGDLLGMGDIDFAAIAAHSRPPASVLAGLGLGFDLTSTPTAAAPAPAPVRAATSASVPSACGLGGLDSLSFGGVPSPAAAQQQGANQLSGLTAPAPRPSPGAGTLGGGAKFVEPPKEEDDPFAMALKKWGK